MPNTVRVCVAVVGRLSDSLVRSSLAYGTRQPPQPLEGRRVQGVEQPSIHVNSARCASVTGNAVPIFVRHSHKLGLPHIEISISHDGMGP